MHNKNLLPPLYIADAIMFVAVIFMSWPYAAKGEVLDFKLALLLSVLVFAAMLLMAAPIVFQYLIAKRAVEDGSKARAAEVQEQIKKIFGTLRTLRDSLLAQIETAEEMKGELESLSADSEAASEKLAALAEAFERFKEESASAGAESEGVNSRLEELEDSCSRLASDFEKSTLACSGRVEAVIAEFSALKAEFEKFYNLWGDECGGGSPENSEGDEPQPVEDSAEDAEDFAKESDEDSETADAEDEPDSYEENDPAEDAGGFGDLAEPTEPAEDLEDSLEASDSSEDSAEENPEAAPEEIEEDDLGAAPIDEPKHGSPNWSGMIDHALSSSQADSTRQTVSRFIENNRPRSAENPGGARGSETPETPGELFPQAEVESRDGSARTAGSGDTAIIVNSFVGIGNRPFVRGTGMGLSEDVGAEMKMLEIGKWQWVCDGIPLSPAKFTVWLNDKIPADIGETAINPGEIVNLDIDFKNAER